MRKTKNRKTTQLTVSEVGRLLQIFTEKNWPVNDEFDDRVFERFCDLLASYNEQQRELLFQLTENYLLIRQTQYLHFFARSFDKFINEYNFNRGKNIYICPLLSEKDFGKQKSSTSLFYLVKTKIEIIKEKYASFNFLLADSPKRVNLELVKNEYTLCLIDDFIGTGDIARSAMDYFQKKGITLEMSSIVSLVGMKCGIQSLSQEGFSVFSIIECPKGISGTNNSEEKRAIMESIEEKMKVEDDFRFGYGASEALVSMARTPNNTFPVYWLKKNNQYAPFPR